MATFDFPDLDRMAARLRAANREGLAGGYEQPRWAEGGLAMSLYRNTRLCLAAGCGRADVLRKIHKADVDAPLCDD